MDLISFLCCKTLLFGKGFRFRFGRGFCFSFDPLLFLCFFSGPLLFSKALRFCLGLLLRNALCFV